jgi:hypothetical protein
MKNYCTIIFFLELVLMMAFSELAWQSSSSSLSQLSADSQIASVVAASKQQEEADRKFAEQLQKDEYGVSPPREGVVVDMKEVGADHGPDFIKPSNQERPLPEDRPNRFARTESGKGRKGIDIDRPSKYIQSERPGRSGIRRSIIDDVTELLGGTSANPTSQPSFAQGWDGALDSDDAKSNVSGVSSASDSDENRPDTEVPDDAEVPGDSLE